MVDTGTKTGKAAFAAALAAVFISVCVLVGWLFDLEVLKRIGPDLVAMNPATAVAFILAGVSLAFFLQSRGGRDRKSRALILTARLCALAVTLIGLAKLGDILFGWDLGVDRWLFASDLADDLRSPNRIATNTAFNFLLLGSALLFVDVKNRFVHLCVEFSAVMVGSGALLALLAYAYDIRSFYGDFLPMALHTAITFSVLVVAVLLSHTDSGLLAVFAGDSAGGMMARRFLPAAVFVPAVLGLLTRQGEAAGLYHGGFSEAAFAVGNILVFTLLVCWSAKELFRADLVRKNAESSLRESEARTSLLVKSSNIGLWDWNLVTNEVFFSPEWKAQLGYTDTELPNRFEEWESRLHPEDREPTLAAVKDYRKGHRADYEVEFRLRHKDGSWRWILTRASLTRDAIGQPVRIMGGHIDITDRKQAEEAMRESEERFAGAFEHAPIGVALVSPEGRWLKVNRALCDLVGYSEAELQTRTILDLTHPEDVELSRENVRRVISGEARSIQIEKRYIHKQGHVITVLLNVSLVRDGQGQPRYFISQLQDTTERKRAEAALLRQAAIIDLSPDAIIVRSQDGTILSWSRGAENLYGWTKEETLGRLTHALFQTRFPEPLEEIMEQFEKTGRWSGELVHRTKDGREVIVQSRWLAEFSVLGEQTGMLESNIDLTERKCAEQAIERALQRLTEAQRIGQIGDWEWDIATQSITWSQQVFEILGRDPRLGPPRNYEENSAIFDAASQAVQTEKVARAIESGEAQDYELRARRPNGEQVDVLGRAVPRKDESGKVVGLVGTVQDITERKGAEAALRESESRYHSLFDNMMEGYAYCQTVFEQDQLRDFTYVEVNSAFERLTGLKDVVGKKVSEVIPGIYEASPELFEVYGRVALTGKPKKYETYLKSLGIWFSVTVYSHEREHFVAVFDNITERKQAETGLRASEAEFRALAEAMPQMVWITQPDGWNIYFSQQWMDYTGLTLEESLGHGWNKPFHPEDQQRAWDAWHQATAANGVYSIESRLRRADGVYRWWLIRAVPQQDATGNILKWFGTCTDIHDLKLAELEISRTNQALRDSDEKFHHLADNISDVFWITSPDLKTMHYVSAGYEPIWGRSTESLYAHPHQWIETILPEEREGVYALFVTLMGTASDISAEYRIARPDGTVRWIHDRGFQVCDAAGQLVRLTGIASDITERKKLEEQLRQAQKMEAIGTLAGGIAHDFNNILAVIIGYSEMAQRGISRESRAQAHLEQILIAGTRARDLVRQILTFSRQEEPEREALELQPIINETLKLLRAALPSTVEIRQNIDTTAPSVLGDATQIQQVLMNLGVNAGQAMAERGGVLEVHLTCLDVDHDFAGAHPELEEGPYICLTVSDSGCGMDRVTQKRIFDPFFTTKAPGEGTGLGLAVVHGVIKNHGGAIVVFSELGVGTTISIYLPVDPRLQAAVIHQSDTVLPGNGEHILFVDDEEALVSLGKLMLEDLGYRVTTRTDSREALAAFTSHPESFDLVITDQTMPHLKGADLATELLEIRPALPVILATGYSSTMSPEIAKEIGIRELLSKPTTMQKLGEAIRHALGESRKD